MNYEQANAVKELTPRVMKVLERLKVECPKCEGLGDYRKNNDIDSTGHYEICHMCNGAKKIHYSWTPQVGEWYWCGCRSHDPEGCVCLIKDEETIEKIKEGNRPYSEVIPILPWEEIERVLEKAGYYTLISDLSVDIKEHEYRFEIWDDATLNGIYRNFRSKSKQEAVMKAVLELGKEIR